MALLTKLIQGLRYLLGRLTPRFRVIVDRERKLGRFDEVVSGYRIDLKKEEVSRRYVFDREGLEMHFLDVGARDGELTYLLGIRGNLEFDNDFYRANHKRFQAKYNYFGMDLAPTSDKRVLSGDACDPGYVERHPEFRGKFDVIYSNNVFEHFDRPWIAASNLTQLLMPGGIIITVVPFSQRYHESPNDYFRYTHKGVEALFATAGEFEVLESGYDIMGRRINWQGSGEANDIVPVDNFGAWRETWFTVCVLRKINSDKG
jgi:SAM-dependent methyltransferase